MNGSDQTGADAAGQANAGGSGQLSDIIAGIGSDAAQGAVGTAQAAIPGLSFTAGQNAAQGALDQLSASIGPHLPEILIAGVALLLFMRR